MGSQSIYKLLNIIPSSNIIFHERGAAWNAKKNDIQFYRKNASKAKIVIANSKASKVMLVKDLVLMKIKFKLSIMVFFMKILIMFP